MIGDPTAGSVLARFPASSRTPTERAVAAVLAVLRDGEDGVEVLLIERAENAADPASGQVGLPGGHVEPGDRFLEETALRECEEEVGIGRAQLTGDPRLILVGRALSSRMRVAVYGSELRRKVSAPRALDPREVASVFWMPQTELGRVIWTRRPTSLGDQSVPAALVSGRILWGFTFRVLRVLFGYGPVEESKELSAEPGKTPPE